MWQVLLAAVAAAGSGILAKKFITHADTEKPIFDCERNDLDFDQNKFSLPRDSISELDDAFEENINREKREATSSDDGKIFRFSCGGTGSGKLRKNGRNGVKKKSGAKREKKNGAVEGGGKEVVVNQIGNGGGKRISICLKKRRTGKNAAVKCESCAPKDNTFGWGVGVGIMYMMSAGKTEIFKLSSAMDETVKSVQELKAEISRRKNIHNVNASVAETKRNYNGPLLTDLSSQSKNNIKTFDPTLSEEGKCSSSILSVDQQPEVLDMHRLEIELESELQKLPWGAMADSSSEGRTDFIEADDLAKEGPPEIFKNSNSYDQYNGVLPGELDQKLCHLLIEQQESQIGELEDELHKAHSKLHQKEAELQALKDCVKRLTEFSLANASDYETEDQEEEVKIVTDEMKEKVGFESTKSMVGMKRTLGYEAYVCSKN